MPKRLVGLGLLAAVAVVFAGAVITVAGSVRLMPPFLAWVLLGLLGAFLCLAVVGVFFVERRGPAGRPEWHLAGFPLDLVLPVGEERRLAS